MKDEGMYPISFPCYPPLNFILSFCFLYLSVSLGRHVQLGQPKLESFCLKICLCLLFLPTCFLIFSAKYNSQKPSKENNKKKVEQKVFSLNAGFISKNQVSMFQTTL